MSIKQLIMTVHFFLRTFSLVIVVLALVPLIVVARHAYDDLRSLHKIGSQLTQNEQKYLQAVKMLTQEKWADAQHAFEGLQNYKDAKVLGAYARAKQLFTQHNFQQALGVLKQIPGTYSGEFASSIGNLRQVLQQKSSQPKLNNPEQQLETRLGEFKDSLVVGADKVFRFLAP